MYFKKAQSKKPCLYEILYDTSDPTNRFVPDREETLTLEKESRSKLNKDIVKPYDYTKQNGLYEIFNPVTQEYHDQLAHANENDSFKFVHELKQEMHADLKYVESLKKEIDELESDKAEFINMYDILLTTQTREPQLPQNSKNTNPHGCTSTGVIHRTNVSRPQLRRTQMKDKVMPNNSQVKFKKTEVEDHHRISSISKKTKFVIACNDSLKSKTSNVNAVCATCEKYVFNLNHDACDSKFLNDVNPLHAAISPTAESPGYIVDSEPEIDPEKEDGDDEEFKEYSIDYPTSRGDDVADDDGDDLSEDDADDEDERSPQTDSDETEPFEEGKTAATPPPFGYRVAARISVQPHIHMSFRSDSEKRACFTTPTGGYEVGESFVAAARQIRPALTIADRRKADDRLIIMDYCQSREVHTRTLVIHIEALQRDKMAPKRARTTRAMTQEAINNLIALRPRIVCPTRECTYKDYLNCGLLKFNDTKGIIGLTRWFERTEAVSNISNCTMEHQTLKQMMTAKYCPRGEVKKLEVRLWNLKVKGTDITSYTLCFQELSLLCGRMFLEESDEIERYAGELPEMIRGNVMSYEPKSMQKAIESANEQMDQKLIGIADRQAENKRKFDNTSRNQQNQQPFKRNNNVVQAYAEGSGEKPYRGIKPLSQTANNNNNNNNQRATLAYQGIPTCFECGAQGHFKNNCSRLGNRNQGNQNQAGNGNAAAKAYGLGTAGGNPNANVVMGFSKIAKSMTKLTQKKVMFNWGDKKEVAFHLLKKKLCSAPILALPEGAENFIVYCNASHKG
nr:hypothetical protein [Tanacetum cinerariifolium]